MKKFFISGAMFLLILGCSSDKSEEKNEQKTQQLQQLKEMQKDLDTKRQELSKLKEELKNAPEDKKEELKSRLEEKKKEVMSLAEEYGGKLVEFINSFAIAEGEEFPPEMKEAIRMKSKEDLIVAQQWIEEAGDWKKAIEIYQMQLEIDPDYQPLKDALEYAKKMRYMDEERFAKAKAGMTQEEIKEILGVPHYKNIREWPEKGVVGWFYPKEDGGASAVYFKFDKQKNKWVAYELKFDAVKGQKQQQTEG